MCDIQLRQERWKRLITTFEQKDLWAAAVREAPSCCKRRRSTYSWSARTGQAMFSATWVQLLGGITTTLILLDADGISRHSIINDQSTGLSRESFSVGKGETSAVACGVLDLARALAFYF